MKYFSGALFIVGIPVACISLLRFVRNSKHQFKSMYRGLIIGGCIVCFLALLIYVPFIILSFSDERLSTFDEIFGSLVWLIPGISLLITGILMRKLKISKGKTSLK
ncbi:MAG: hypothetical protein E3J78_01375 [Candidatus Cloacimonadota bacterium]|nr:MAG: hypothetical protein E3J78_01375 [Candidatus Cloacimonadota bacterium]